MSDEYIPGFVDDVFEGEIAVPYCGKEQKKEAPALPPAKKPKSDLPDGYHYVNIDFPGDRHRLWFEISDAQIARAMEDPWKEFEKNKK